MDGNVASWDGLTLCLGDVRAGEAPVLSVIEAGPDGESPFAQSSEAAKILLWPLETLILRHFSLPLSHTKFLDDAVLSQEMDDQTGEDAADWWLAWKARPVSDGVQGVLAALPAHAKGELSSQQLWSGCPFVGVDAWVRLSARLPESPSGDCAVLDTDADGWFLGVYTQGGWQGMRRLNRSASRDTEEITQDILRSFSAMGIDAASQPVCGQIDADVAAILLPSLGDWQGSVLDDLPGRHEASVLAASASHADLGPNFRRGSWAASGGWRQYLRPMRRAAILAVALLALLFGNDAYSVLKQQQHASDLHAGIEAAFHRGLPKEKVIIDPLAQLRAAAGMQTSGSVQARLILNRIQSVAEAKAKYAGFEIVQLNYSNSVMSLSGTALGFDVVNKIRDVLSVSAPAGVQIEDTVMEGKQVRFRIKWL